MEAAYREYEASLSNLEQTLAANLQTLAASDQAVCESSLASCEQAVETAHPDKEGYGAHSGAEELKSVAESDAELLAQGQGEWDVRVEEALRLAQETDALLGNTIDELTTKGYA
jgi:hypothetical protein